MTSPSLDAFIRKWRSAGGAERANAQPFLCDLCELLGVPGPDPAQPEDRNNAYVFERRVIFQHGDGSSSHGYIDLYKRGCFVLESKQGVRRKEAERLSQAGRDSARAAKKGIGPRHSPAWDDAMLRAKGQAEQYARALPAEEGRPPFLVVVDVGHSIELYSEFTRTGGAYVPFPDPQTHRLLLSRLDQDDLDLLRAVWTDPLSLDPARRTARVTREIADRLARLARSLELAGHAPEDAAGFLMRCLFTMFAEDVGLLEKESFSKLLRELRDRPENFPPMIESLWQSMKTGGFSPALRSQVMHFNGFLFEDVRALALTRDQIELLIEAARADWREVDPAIFGTLLERALDPRERHKLGAHFTPPAYVERLVMAAVIGPVRGEWEAVQAAALTFARQNKTNEAIKAVQAFHRKLCRVRVLDPACGTGNFLYVILMHLKRIEGEVLRLEQDLGYTWIRLEGGLTINPSQLLGLEVNPRAAAIANLVLWIGYLQWHFRTMGHVRPAEPVIRKFTNITCRDALLDWDAIEEVRDAKGQILTRWDGRTTRPHPTTGREVPDETARAPVLRYVNPRPAVWPEADYIAGNPPFIGPARMREALGDGYTEAVRATHTDVPESCDFVMYWWNHAATLARQGKIQRFGFIATNSLRQTFNRRILQHHMQADPPLSLLYAVPDHPWVDEADGAAVRISMTVAAVGEQEGVLETVVSENSSGELGRDVVLEARRGRLWSDLTVGADIASVSALKANQDISCRGVQLIGSGFIVTPPEAERLGLGRIPGLDRHIREYRHGRDITARPRGVMVIDLFGLRAEEVRERYPEVYQWVVERVKPERDQNNRKGYRENWWIHGEPRGNFRPALVGLQRYVTTSETAKHRFFVFLDQSILPDNMLVNIAHEDAFVLGVLSSRIHVVWALAVGGKLGVGNDPRYNKTRCFETFPFPVATEDQKARIRELAERLDGHRKSRQELHPDLTMTGMYNVLEKLRSGEALSAKERTIHEQGLVAVLKELHDELDRAVALAYGWPEEMTDDEILERLVRLNQERAAEERRGLVRWLRPEYQNPGGISGERAALGVSTAPEAVVAKGKKSPWPATMPEQVQAVRAILAASPSPATADAIAKSFTRAPRARIAEILETLAALGTAREVEEGRFIGQ
ncbi:class I SAM-dependent DNA methyltransferase [Desulfonatronum thiodismutans]|uniref:class I SAM-dependent DNA methyltransferase n=1 Tax=Desulfonatronum thiodismutans TaxID=159290 RepID=UPI0004ABDEE5|nr:DNA methyltransferase [Desulfonatronum thiodismutans]